MTPEQTKRFKYWQTRTIIATMVGYALFYFVRKNFSLAMPGLEADLGISKTSLGIFLTLNGVVYGLSRFVNGILADRMNARWYMAIGLALCALANFAFGFGEDVSYWITGQHDGSQFTNTMILFMGIMWVINGMLQGDGIPSLCASADPLDSAYGAGDQDVCVEYLAFDRCGPRGDPLRLHHGYRGHEHDGRPRRRGDDRRQSGRCARRCCRDGARHGFGDACWGLEMVFLGAFGHRIRRGDRIGRLPARYALFGRASRTGRHRGEGGEKRRRRVPSTALS